MKNTSFLILGFLLVFSGCIGIKKTMPVNEFLEYKMDKANIVGLQAAVIKNGQVTISESVGYKNIKDKTKVNDSTLFMIGSTSKPVTAVALMVLVDRQLIKLDDPINPHLPFKVFNPNFPEIQITFRMLLSHVGGLKDNWDVVDSSYTIETGGGDSPISLKEFNIDYFEPSGKYYNKEKNFELAKPGEKKEYANVGYGLIGYLIERITKQKFNDFCRKEIFIPLGMNNTYWFLKNIPHNNIAYPHEVVDSGHKVLNHYGYPTYPDGQLRTSVTDYAKFLQLLMNQGKVGNKNIIDKSGVEELLKIQYPDVDKWQAIAWNYNSFEYRFVYMHVPRLPAHTGGDPGVATAVFFDKDKKAAVLVFTNTSINSFKSLIGMYVSVLKRLSKEAGMK